MKYIKRKIRGITELKCTCCEETKSISEFTPRNHVGSWCSHCKRCRVIKNNEYNKRRRQRKQNKTGYPGIVCVNGKYRARIKISGQHIYLGTRDKPEEAAELYRRQKEICLKCS